MADRNIKMHQYNGSGYDNLYPQTKMGNITDWLNTVYPVGSIYMTVNNTNPSNVMGGSWQRIQNCFLLAAGDNHAAGSTGGSATHTLTKAELPNYSLDTEIFASSSTEQTGGSGRYLITAKDFIAPRSTRYWTSSSGVVSVSSGGSGQAMNIMPPYLAVYVWKRVA